MKTATTCPFCGNEIDPNAVKCPFCNELLYEEELAPLPKELKHFNWGAFLIPLIWGIANKTYITLLPLLFLFIPIFGTLINFGLSIWFGIKGNEWAWRNKEWGSAEVFNKVQKKWVLISFLIFFIISLITTMDTIPKLMKETDKAAARTECKTAARNMQAAMQINESKTGRPLSSYKTTEKLVNMLKDKYIGVTASTSNSFTLKGKYVYKFNVKGVCRAKNKNCVVKITTSDPSKNCSYYIDTKTLLEPTPITKSWLSQ